MKMLDGRTETTVAKLKFDPQLHLLRTVANAIEDDRQRQEATSARFNLYAALEAGDAGLAKNWLDALEATLTLTPDISVNARLATMAQDAINAIRRGLNDSRN